MATVEFNSEKAATTSPHYISGLDWRVQLVDGLNEIPDDMAEKLQEFEGIDYYLERGAIVFRSEPETPFQRLHELEELYKSQGYQPIATIATQYGIAKPTTGWKDAIPLIVEYEKSQNEAD